ncbi:MAG: SPFH domain-containing protein [Planctomycetota bacterium]
MSEQDQPNTSSPGSNGSGTNATGAPLAAADVEAPRRTASLTLRSEEDREGDPSTLMDPANRSLAEALRITFRVVQAAMIVLAGLFAFSGFQRIEENEIGVSVFLGKARQTDLGPGPHLAAPYPLGDLIKVNTGVNEVVVSAFFPNALDKTQDPAETIDNGGYSAPSLERDGMLITADLNIAHAWWEGRWRRTDPASTLEHIHPNHEARIVEALLKRGALHAVASEPIDALLKGEVRDIRRRAQETAQASLDVVAGESRGAGIELDDVTISPATPPLELIEKFAAVSNARSERGKARSDAESDRSTILNGVAGRAAPLLIDLIGDYELLVETGDRGGAAAVLETIDAVMAGETVAVEGVTIDPLVSGQVAEILSSADNTYRAITTDAEAQKLIFEAKLAQFEANPRLLVTRDWREALSEFLDKPFVQTMMLPVGGMAELLINEDPDILRELERERNRLEGERAFEQRERDRAAAAFRTDRGIERER